MSNFVKNVDNSFNEMEARLDNLTDSADQHDSQLNAIGRVSDVRLDKMEETIEGFRKYLADTPGYNEPYVNHQFVQLTKSVGDAHNRITQLLRMGGEQSDIRFGVIESRLTDIVTVAREDGDNIDDLIANCSLLADRTNALDQRLTTRVSQLESDSMQRGGQSPDTVYCDHLMPYVDRITYNLSNRDKIMYDEIHDILNQLDDDEIKQLMRACKMTASSNIDGLITE